MADESHNKGALGTVSDVAAIAKTLVLPVFLAVLLLFPTWVGTRVTAMAEALARSGVTELSPSGITWKAEATQYGRAAEQLQQEAQAARTELSNTLRQLELGHGELRGLQQQTQNPVVQQRLERLVQATESQQQQVRETRLSLTRSLAQTAPTVNRAREVVGSAEEWAVLIGTDTSLSAAQTEVGRAAPLGSPLVLRRGNRFVTVVPADSSAAAGGLRDRAGTIFGQARGVRVIDLRIFCPRRIPADGYLICAGG